jgi:hypothetical protein
MTHLTDMTDLTPLTNLTPLTDYPFKTFDLVI